MRLPRIKARYDPPLDQERVWLDLVEHGVYYHDDPISGLRIDKMVQLQTPLTSANGLKFFQSQVLNHHLIRPILLSVFDRFGLILYRSLGMGEGDYCYKTSAGRPDIDGLIVHLVSKGTKLSFWEGSHMMPLSYQRSEKSLWYVPRRVLMTKLLSRVDLSFKQGGFIITDPRTVFSINEGFTVTLAFGEMDLVEKFGKVEVVYNQDVHRVLQTLESNRFTMNAKFIDE